MAHAAGSVSLFAMSDADLAEILKLPSAEKLRLMELLWESLSAAPADLSLGEAHRAALDEALAEHRRDPDDVVSLDEVLAETRSRR